MLRIVASFHLGRGLPSFSHLTGEIAAARRHENTTHNSPSRTMPSAAQLSTKELNAAWDTTRKRRVSTKVNVGDHLGVMFQGAEYHVVITKVNKVTFNVEYDDGSVAEKVAINDERGPRNPDGAWRRVSPDTVFATTVESEDELPEDVPLSDDEDDDDDDDETDEDSSEEEDVEEVVVRSSQNRPRSSSSSSEEEEDVEEVVVMSSQKRRRVK